MLLNSPAITSHCLYNAAIRKMRVSLRQSKNFGDHITFSHTCYRYKYTKVAFPIILEKVFDVVFNYITHHIRWHKSYVACEKNVHFTLSFTEDLTKPISRSLIPYFCNRLSIICNYSWKSEVSFDHFFFWITFDRNRPTIEIAYFRRLLFHFFHSTFCAACARHFCTFYPLFYPQQIDRATFFYIVMFDRSIMHFRYAHNTRKKCFITWTKNVIA